MPLALSLLLHILLCQRPRTLSRPPACLPGANPTTFEFATTTTALQ
jgi:hypothetical protein